MKRLALCLFVMIATAPGNLAAQSAPSTPAPNEQATPATAETPATRDKAPEPSQIPGRSPSATAPADTAPQTDGTGGKTPTEILLPHDLSPWSMFLSADIVVKVVMVGLAFASLMTWTVFFGKSLEFGAARRRLRRGLSRLDGVKSFAEAKIALGKKDRVLARLLGAALAELSLSDGSARDGGVKERAESRIAELVRAESQSMRRGMPLLATIGSTAPFVGLFGTVWGIMNAFIGISKSQTTNLAVVAPGIAEALLATAIGLVAAIPAVVIYNHFSQSGRRYQSLLFQASGSIQRLLSRELDRRPAGTALRVMD